MQVAIELMCPGVPVIAWAIMLPRVSKTPAERSPDSRTTVVKEVRISAVACSLTTEMRRFQRTSRVMGSMAVGGMGMALSLIGGPDGPPGVPPVETGARG